MPPSHKQAGTDPHTRWRLPPTSEKKGRRGLRLSRQTLSPITARRPRLFFLPPPPSPNDTAPAPLLHRLAASDHPTGLAVHDAWCFDIFAFHGNNLNRSEIGQQGHPYRCPTDCARAPSSCGAPDSRSLVWLFATDAYQTPNAPPPSRPPVHPATESCCLDPTKAPRIPLDQRVPARRDSSQNTYQHRAHPALRTRPPPTAHCRRDTPRTAFTISAQR